MKLRKARVMERRDLKLSSWTEIHCGIVISENSWGAQIYDPNSQFNNGISPEMWGHCEWFPWISNQQKVELI